MTRKIRCAFVVALLAAFGAAGLGCSKSGDGGSPKASGAPAEGARELPPPGSPGGGGGKPAPGGAPAPGAN